MTLSPIEIKNKLQELSTSFKAEKDAFESFVLIHKYWHFLSSQKTTKTLMQRFFDDHIKAESRFQNEALTNDNFTDIKRKISFEHNFWVHFSNIETIGESMDELRQNGDSSGIENLKVFYAKPYARISLFASFEAVNFRLLEELNKMVFLKNGEKTYFDEGKSLLYIQGKRAQISKQDKITGAHKIMKYIFIDNSDNMLDDFYYSEIAEDEFGDIDYRSKKDGWKKYHNICLELNNKIEKAIGKDNFLIYNTGRRGKLCINRQYL